MRPSLSIGVIALSVLALAGASCRPSLPAAAFPQDWLGSPGNESEQASPLSPRAEANLAGTVDQILEVHRQVLEGQAPVDPSLPCPRPWGLVAYLTSFGISVDGVLGALIGSGSAFSTAVWRQATEREARPQAMTGVAKPRIAVTSADSHAALLNRLEPSIRGALSAGIIQDERALRANLSRVVSSFQAMARELDSLQLRDAAWAPGIFRLDLGFDASGSLVPLASVGAGVQFGFFWERKRASGGSRALSSAPLTEHPIATMLRAFVDAVSRDLGALEENAAQIEGHGFRLGEIRLGVGLTASGNLGFAQASTEMMGSLIFYREGGGHHARRAPRAVKPFGPEDEGTLELITSAETLRATQPLSARLDAWALKNEDEGKAVVRIHRSRFRQGLRRANWIAGFFVRRASAAQKGRWAIRDIATEYEMSLTGTLGLVTVTGSGLVELGYENVAI